MHAVFPHSISTMPCILDYSSRLASKARNDQNMTAMTGTLYAEGALNEASLIGLRMDFARCLRCLWSFGG